MEGRIDVIAESFESNWLLGRFKLLNIFIVQYIRLKMSDILELLMHTVFLNWNVILRKMVTFGSTLSHITVIVPTLGQNEL